ncbi:MAG: F0F1 ATP synthase subunit epsilon [Breznakibacter sp.]|nr:F0F1 ATP synthase subunit epsilon [Breznakibacter sp.]
MMALYLDVITPEKTLYSAPVMLVTIPGANGAFTILQQHAPIISILSQGEVRLVGQDGVERNFSCQNGVVECKNDKVVVLIEKG